MKELATLLYLIYIDEGAKEGGGGGGIRLETYSFWIRGTPEHFQEPTGKGKQIICDRLEERKSSLPNDIISLDLIVISNGDVINHSIST